MKLFLTILFFLALSSTIYFFSKLLTWAVYLIINHPSKFKPNEISIYTLIGLISVLLWSVIFYNLI